MRTHLRARALRCAMACLCAVLAFVAALGVPARASHGAPKPERDNAGAQERPRLNVLLVTIDALRADRVSEKLTPALAVLGARGTRFERAYAHAPLTLPAHASILTGLLPPAHGVRNNGFRLDDAVVTLAELLSGAGYQTGAFVGASTLDTRFGLSQGFGEYDDHHESEGSPRPATLRPHTRPASNVLAATAAWIGRQREPWFAWSHLRDPHAPYASYEQAVASADAALGAFLSSPPVRGLLERTVVVVTADHGESLGDHEERTHGLLAYESALRVPLVVAGPGVPQRAVVAPAVSHADIAPTVIDLVGAEARAFDGRSLVPILRGEQVDEQPIYFEALDAALMRGGAPLTGVVAGRWKYIDLPLPELYDVVADPGERYNREPREPAVATSLRDATIARRTRGPRADAAGTLAEPEARARLRSLGYVGSASWRLGTSRVEDDPKRLLPLHLAYEAAIDAADTDPDGALTRLRSILEQRPDYAAALDAAGALLLARGRAPEAIALLHEARAGGLRHRVLAERLAEGLLATKHARDAVTVLAPIIEADGAAVDARLLLARALSATGDVAGARAQLEAALQIDPTFPAASELLARLGKGRP